MRKDTKRREKKRNDTKRHEKARKDAQRHGKTRKDTPKDIKQCEKTRISLDLGCLFVSFRVWGSILVLILVVEKGFSSNWF